MPDGMVTKRICCAGLGGASDAARIGLGTGGDSRACSLVPDDMLTKRTCFSGLGGA